MPESSVSTSSMAVNRRPSVFARSVGLMKPVTWFAPAWAFLCGAIASGAPLWSWQTLGLMALGVFLAGPIVCGLSQVINDYCDKDVDAINEPQRLIPSGLVSNKQIFITIGILSALALSIAWFLGEKVALLTAIGMVLAVIYSAHPVRAKRNGWIGNALVAISYEGLPWLAGHLAFADLTLISLMIAIWYSVGAHGIMTINDFKSIEGDKMAGINTIPVMYGAWGGAWIAVLTMNTSQLFVIMILAATGRWVAASIIAGLFLLQLPFQTRLIRDPKGQAVFYNATGILLFVLGMLVAAIGLR